MREFAPNEVQKVVATVYVCVPEFELVLVRDAEGNQYALTHRTAGIKLTDLVEGQRIECVVTLRLPRVLSASVI